MSGSLPYYPFYVSDFDEDELVLPMNLSEVGLYVLALNESWKRGSIPASLPALALRIRRPLSEVKRSWPKVAPCWKQNGTSDTLINSRQEKERAKASDKSNKARLSALRRYETDAKAPANADAKGNAIALLRASESSSSSKNTKNSSELYFGQFEDFERFWSGYWRKVSKSTAKESFCKHVISKDRFGLVMVAIAIQRPAMLGRDMESRPHASTWLNQHRWEDEPEAYQPSKSTRISAFDQINRAIEEA